MGKKRNISPSSGTNKHGSHKRASIERIQQLHDEVVQLRQSVAEDNRKLSQKLKSKPTQEPGPSRKTKSSTSPVSPGQSIQTIPPKRNLRSNQTKANSTSQSSTRKAQDKVSDRNSQPDNAESAAQHRSRKRKRQNTPPSSESSGDEESELSAASSEPKHRHHRRPPVHRRNRETRHSSSRDTDSGTEESSESSQDDNRHHRYRHTRRHRTRDRNRSHRSSHEGKHYFTHSDSSSSSDSDSDTDNLISFGSIVGEHVSPKLRRKIVQNKYVDMSSLLPQLQSSKTPSPTEYTFKIGKNNNTKLVKNRITQDITIQQWQDAFDVYMAIYIGKRRSKSQLTKTVRAMLTYRKLINDMNKAGHDWAGYDRHYRRDREMNGCPWTTIRHDLYIQYSNYNTHRNNFRPFQSYTKKSTTTLRTADGKPIPPGYCIAFHSWNQRCSAYNCRYQHQCPRCQARHPMYRQCNNTQTSNQLNIKPTNTPPNTVTSKTPISRTTPIK